MEAVGSGLGMIGLNVNYGAQPLFEMGKMATWYLLVPMKIVWMIFVAKLAHAIVMYFNNGSEPHYISYEVAQQFMTQDIILKWETLVQEVLHG